MSTLGNLSEIEKKEGVWGLDVSDAISHCVKLKSRCFPFCLQRGKARVKLQQIYYQLVQLWRCFKTHGELIKILALPGPVNTSLFTETVFISCLRIPALSCFILKSQLSQTRSNQAGFSEWRRIPMSDPAELLSHFIGSLPAKPLQMQGI